MDDEVRLLDHPLVPIADGEALRCGLDALRKNGVGVVRQPIFVPLLRHIRENDVISDRMSVNFCYTDLYSISHTI